MEASHSVTERIVRGGVLLALVFGMATIARPPDARAASSTDYPGPCAGETYAPPGPIYLSADYHGLNPAVGFLSMPAAGRIRLGISCVATGFAVARVGADSALCTLRGRCTFDDLQGLTEQDIDAVRGLPGEVPFFHICRKHGFAPVDAYMLHSVACDLKVSEIVDAPNWIVTSYCPLSIFG